MSSSAPVRDIALVAAGAGLGIVALLAARRLRRWKEPTCRAEWLREPPKSNRPRVAVVATGSVASVKIPELVEKLSKLAEVTVILTAPGEVMTSQRVAGRYAPEHFRAWEALQRSGVHVLRDDDEWMGYENISSDSVVHIELRRWADVALVAPCSANTLAKLALGLCDNLATCFLRAWDPDKPLLIAPAMNTLMWEHPSTLQHLTTLQARGSTIIPPVSKTLACGDVGRGALAPVSEILQAVEKAFVGATARRASSGIGSWRVFGFEDLRQVFTGSRASIRESLVLMGCTYRQNSVAAGVGYGHAGSQPPQRVHLVTSEVQARQACATWGLQGVQGVQRDQGDGEVEEMAELQAVRSQQGPAVALDCEGVRLGRFGRICLLQLQDSKGHVLLCDALRKGVVEALAPLLESRRVVKVMHDCREDSAALFHQHGIQLRAVFDTQVAHAILERRAGREAYQASASELLKEYLGIEPEQTELKSRMLQDPDLWARRPLTSDLVRYALHSVSHLLQLHHKLVARGQDWNAALGSGRHPDSRVMLPLVTVRGHPNKQDVQLGDLVLCCVSGVSLDGKYIYLDRYDHDWDFFDHQLRPSLQPEVGAYGREHRFRRGLGLL
ncbi:HAL3B [Symbiodinium natans]|uniref:HAL3B protein n=1 Tax=Symbiodinium natans TaxID=878477 RepID=A0A812JK47_9DINO|nr:HAL3B [Symbiodinium natans]